jgi:hypothetical protein
MFVTLSGMKQSAFNGFLDICCASSGQLDYWLKPVDLTF